jgi:N-acyl-D-amino-acid deacylase
LPRGKVTLLLKGATVYDGTGSPPETKDIGIKGGTIVFVGEGFNGEAETVMDLKGLSVAPGFIDTHGHSEFTLLADPTALGKVLQGITTEINGNCGLSAAPMLGEARARREDDLREYDIAERWETLEEYLSLLEKREPGLNFATLAGHGSVRASVIGYADREPSPEELDRMKGLLRETLEAGAIGFSTGLIYPPGIYSTTEELVGLARYGSEVAPGPFIYASHMRSEGERLIEAVEETVKVGSEAGVSVHISHIKTAGRENWDKAGAAIEVMERARAAGVRATCDRYPYTAGSSDLDSVLPGWVFEGGADEELKRLKDPAMREKIKGELTEDDECWEGVVISSVPGESGRWLEGLNIKDIAARMGVDCKDALLDVLVKEGIRVGAVFHGMSEENLWRFLSLPYAMAGSDSAMRSFSGPTARGKPHPRGFGTFPRFLKNYPAGLSEAIHKATALPAATFGLEGRGVIREGFTADIVAFDRERLADKATYEKPFQRPVGVYHVIINGVPSVLDGEPTGQRPGRVLRGGG